MWHNHLILGRACGSGAEIDKYYSFAYYGAVCNAEAASAVDPEPLLPL
jgi:hypothetical protein